MICKYSAAPHVYYVQRRVRANSNSEVKICKPEFSINASFRRILMVNKQAH